MIRTLTLLAVLALAGCAADIVKQCPSGKPLSGCCSSHGGIDKVLTAGAVMCKKGEPSPTCRCDVNP